MNSNINPIVEAFDKILNIIISNQPNYPISEDTQDQPKPKPSNTDKLDKKVMKLKPLTMNHKQILTANNQLGIESSRPKKNLTDSLVYKNIKHTPVEQSDNVNILETQDVLTNLPVVTSSQSEQYTTPQEASTTDKKYNDISAEVATAVAADTTDKPPVAKSPTEKKTEPRVATLVGVPNQQQVQSSSSDLTTPQLAPIQETNDADKSAATSAAVAIALWEKSLEETQQGTPAPETSVPQETSVPVPVPVPVPVSVPVSVPVPVSAKSTIDANNEDISAEIAVATALGLGNKSQPVTASVSKDSTLNAPPPPPQQVPPQVLPSQVLPSQVPPQQVLLPPPPPQQVLPTPDAFAATNTTPSDISPAVATAFALQTAQAPAAKTNPDNISTELATAFALQHAPAVAAPEPVTAETADIPAAVAAAFALQTAQAPAINKNHTDIPTAVSASIAFQPVPPEPSLVAPVTATPVTTETSDIPVEIATAIALQTAQAVAPAANKNSADISPAALAAPAEPVTTKPADIPVEIATAIALQTAQAPVTAPGPAVAAPVTATPVTTETSDISPAVAAAIASQTAPAAVLAPETPKPYDISPAVAAAIASHTAPSAVLAPETPKPSDISPAVATAIALQTMPPTTGPGATVAPGPVSPGASPPENAKPAYIPAVAAAIPLQNAPTKTVLTKTTTSNGKKGLKNGDGDGNGNGTEIDPVITTSQDSVTYVTKEGIVYIYSNGKMVEYEGSIDNNNIREVRATPDSSDTGIEVFSDGKFEKLTTENFKDLYPITSKEYEHKNDIFTIIKKTALNIFKINDRYLKNKLDYESDDEDDDEDEDE